MATKRPRVADENRPPESPADNYAAVFTGLREWVCVHGGIVAGVTPDANGRHIVADKRGLEPGTTILRIPEQCLLQGHRLSELKRMTQLRCDAGDLSLALAILEERRLGTDSRYAPYIRCLPGWDLMDSLPLWWPERELSSLLGGSDLLHAAQEARAAAEHDAKALRVAKLLPPSDDDRLLFWALACVTSRAFEAGEHGNVMVPLLDLLNHSRPREVSYDYLSQLPSNGGCGSNSKSSKSTGGFEVVALQAIAQGAEVHDTYGAKGSGDLLLHYGFTITDNAEPDGSLNDTVQGV